MLFDTHTHSYFSSIADRQDEIIVDMQTHGIRYAVQIGCDISTSQLAIDYARTYESYFATVGYHPNEGQNLTHDEIHARVSELESLLLTHRESIVGIGEIGFDYHYLESGREAEQKEAQRILFFAMIELAKRYSLPVVIHTRDAWDDTFRYIRESGIRKAIIHCFSEDVDFARMCMEYSDEIYFGFSGIVTYPRSLQVQEAAKFVPLDRILIETDAPFLSPQKVRGTLNTPVNVRYVLEAIKNLRDEDDAEIEQVIFENSLRFYWITS